MPDGTNPLSNRWAAAASKIKPSSLVFKLPILRSSPTPSDGDGGTHRDDYPDPSRKGMRRGSIISSEIPNHQTQRQQNRYDDTGLGGGGGGGGAGGVLGGRGGGADLSSEDQPDCQAVRSGDYITLYAESPSFAGHATVLSFNDSNITVDPNLVPKNFDRSGVFQIVGVGAGAKIGTAVRYGASVAFQHRFTQKYVCRGRNDELLLTAARPGVPPGVQCWFRPMPRIKLFAEGQIVTVNARVLIESFSPASSPSWISLLRKSNSNGGSSNLGDDVNQVISSSKASAMDDNSDDIDSNAILAVTSTKVTGIQLRMFATHTVGSRGHLLKGGDFVRLFHQEHTALLEVQSVYNHRRNRHGFNEHDIEHKVVLCPISDAIVNGDDISGVASIWQVELGETNRGGRALHWEDSIRLKNVISDGYLDFEALNEDGSAGISMDRLRSSAVTLAAPHNARIGLDDTVSSTAPFYIKGTEGRWLHVSSKTARIHQPQQHFGAQDSFQVSFVGTKRDEDAFNVQPVDLADIQDLFIAKAHQATVVAMLNRLDIWNLSKASKEFARYAHSIDSLFDFCSGAGESGMGSGRGGERGAGEVGDLGGAGTSPTAKSFQSSSWTAVAQNGGSPMHQKLLVDLDIPTILIEFTSQAFANSDCTDWALLEDSATVRGQDRVKSRSASTWDVHLAEGRLQAFNVLAQKSYKLLQQLVLGNPLAGYTIFNRFKLPITNQCRLLGKIASIEWNVASFLEEAFSNNLLLMSEIDTEYVRALVKVIEDAHSLIDLEQYCLLLSSVCVHDGNAIVDVQDAIRDQIIGLLPQARIDSESGDVMILYRSPRLDKPYKEWDSQLLQLHNKFPSVTRSDMGSVQEQQHLAFLAAVLKLLSQICVGRRKSSRDLVIKQFASFETTMAVLRDKRIHPTIRSGFAQLCRKVFVDADPLSNDLILDRDWNDVANQKVSARNDDAIASLVPSTQAWDGQLMAWLELFLVQSHESSLKLDALQVYIGWKHSGHQGNPSQVLAAKIRMEDEMARNKLLVSTLDLCADMCRNGFFDNKRDQRRNLEYFLLDILKDAQSASLRHNERSAAHVTVCDALRLVCDNLTQLLKLRSRACLTDLLLAFKRVYTDQQVLMETARQKKSTLSGSFKSKKASAITTSAIAAGDVLAGLTLNDILVPESSMHPSSAATHNLEGTAPSGDDSGSGGGSNDGGSSLQFWFSERGMDSADFVDLVVGLLHYNDECLRTSALGLLFASFSVRETAVELLASVTIAADSHETAFLRDLYDKKMTIKLAEHGDLGNSHAELLHVVEWLNGRLSKSEHSTVAVKRHQDTMRHVQIHAAVLDFVSEHLLIRDAENVEKKLQQKGIRYLFAQCFHFFALFAANNTGSQSSMITSKVWNVLVCACRHNVGAENAMVQLLQLPEAMACMHMHTEDIRTLTHNLFDFSHCRTTAYMRMLCKIAGAAAGSNADERQALLFEVIFHSRNVESVFGVGVGGGHNYGSSSARIATSDINEHENDLQHDHIFVKMAQKLKGDADLQGEASGSLPLTPDLLLLVELVELHIVCIFNNAITTKLMQEKISASTAVQILLQSTFKRFPLKLKDVLIRFVHLLYMESGVDAPYDSSSTDVEQRTSSFIPSAFNDEHRDGHGRQNAGNGNVSVEGISQTSLLSRTQIFLQTEVDACIRKLLDTIESCNREKSGKSQQSMSSDAFIAIDLAGIRSNSVSTTASSSRLSSAFDQAFDQRQSSIAREDDYAIATLSSACNSLLERSFAVLTERSQGAGADLQYLHQHTMALAKTLSEYFKCRSLACADCNLSVAMQDKGSQEVWRLLNMVRAHGDHRLDEVQHLMTLLEQTCEVWEQQAHMWRSRVAGEFGSATDFGQHRQDAPVKDDDESESQRIARSLKAFAGEAQSTISRSIIDTPFVGTLSDVKRALGTKRANSPGFWVLVSAVKSLLSRSDGRGENGRHRATRPLSPSVMSLASTKKGPRRQDLPQNRQLVPNTNVSFLWKNSNNKVAPAGADREAGTGNNATSTDASMGLHFLFRQYQHPQESSEFAPSPSDVVYNLIHLLHGILLTSQCKETTQKLCNAGLTAFLLCQMTFDSKLTGAAARLSSRVLIVTNLQFQAKFVRIMSRSRHTSRMLMHVRQQCYAIKRPTDQYGTRVHMPSSEDANYLGSLSSGRASPVSRIAPGNTPTVGRPNFSGSNGGGSIGGYGSSRSESLLPALKFAANLCSGCYRPAQDILRDQHSLSTINLLSVLCESLTACSASAAFKLLRGHGATSAVSRSFPNTLLKRVANEVHNTSVVEALLRTIVAMISGHRESQQVLESHSIPLALPSLLSLMGPQGNDANSLSTFVLLSKAGLNTWMKEYKVSFHVHTGGSGADSEHPESMEQHRTQVPAVDHVILSQSELNEAAQLHEQLEELNKAVRQCEDALLKSVVAYLEGRHSADQAFDTVTKALFENVSLAYFDKSLLFKGLNMHWKTSTGPDADRDAAISYYIVLSQLASGSKLYGPTIQRLLTKWDNMSTLRDHIGRFELVRGGVLSPIYFPLPKVVAQSKGSETLQRIKENVLSSTHLLDDTARVQQFLQNADLIIAITRQQAYYSTHTILKWLLHERIVAVFALLITMGLNGMYIASVVSTHLGWGVLGVSHTVLALVMVVMYLLNHTVIDKSRSNDCTSSASSKFEALIKLAVFWIFQTRLLFQILYLVFSVLGLAVSHSYYVFALLDVVSMFGGMQIIQNAMFASATKLTAMLGLAVVVLYGLAVVGQNEFNGNYSFPGSEHVVACEADDKFSDCFRDHLYTFGERAVFDDVIPTGAAFVYAVFYNVVVVFLLSGIFVGIITDSFGQLRQEEAELRKARESYCYCCSHSRSELEERSPFGFKGHVLHEHNVWCVVWFIIHVVDKSEAADFPLSGAEQHFLNAHLEHRVAKLWPFKRALSIDGTTNVAKGLDQVISMLGGLIAQSDSTADNLAELGGSISALSRLTHLRVAALLHAAADGNIMEMETLISQTNVDPNSSDYDGRVALHIAASEGQEAAVRFLLAQGARPDVRDRWGKTPLQSAEKFPGVRHILEECSQLHSK